MPDSACRSAMIADIGGTNVRFALIGADGKPNNVSVLTCSDYPDLLSAANAYLDGIVPEDRPDHGAFAAACPVTGDQVQVTNLPWSFSIDDLRRQLGFKTLDVINDFSAIAYALPRLATGDRRQIGGGGVHECSPVAVLGSGTGLGVSALVPADGGWVALETEGGHITMAANNEHEAQLIDSLRSQFGHVSAERVLSGPGLVNLYETISTIAGIVVEPLTPEQVSERGLGEPASPCGKTIEMFCAMLGTFASDLALSLGARGGVYIAGGIVPSLGNAFDRSGFRSRFEEKGRFSAYLAKIPTFVIVHPHPAFVGLRAFLDRKTEQPKGGAISRR